MGLLGKLRNIFYDEEIVEVPEKEIVVKKEVETRPRIEEVEVPKREESIKRETRVQSDYNERDLFKNEPSFKFPVIDEDDDEPIKTRSRSNTLDIEKKEEPIKREVQINREIKKPNINLSMNSSVNANNISVESGKNTFKPSPVISPVYGILDKNYKKEEIVEKAEPTVRPSGSGFNYDYVRRKAYGTLEDELENTLTKLSSEVMDDVNDLVSEEVDNGKSIEDLLSEIEGNANISIGEIEEKLKDEQEKKEETNEVSVNDDEIKIDEGASLEVDKTLEHDLFNLIDSMYEEKEGE